MYHPSPLKRNKMKKLIKNVLENFGYRISKYNKISEVEELLLKNGISPDTVTIEGNLVYLKKLDIKIDKSHHSFILQGYNFLLLLSQKVNAKFESLADGKIIAQIYNHRVYLNTWEEILILKEIYIDGIYNFNIGGCTSDAIFIDIGMNVGFTSLFFAQKDEISKVYSFEPFPNTYKMALDNFSLNFDIKSKIIPYNWGLGENNKTEIWDYNTDYKGSMGKEGLPAHIYLDTSKNEKITVSIKDVSIELNRIIEENKEKKIILKIDCEGAEYEIIEKLFTSNILDSFVCIMIEWHVKGPKKLLELLESKNYYSFSFNEHDQTIGMIYATKRSL